MTKITMTKKGIGTVILQQGEYRDGQRYYTITANGVTTSLKDAYATNMAYKHYLAAGWTVKPEEAEKPEEKAVAAPKEPKPQKTRAEALEEKYGDIETRREYINKKIEISKEVRAEIYEWVKSHRRLTRDEYKDQLKKGITQKMAQWKAENEACIG